LLCPSGMSTAKRPTGVRSPPSNRSEKRVKAAPVWRPTVPSATITAATSDEDTALQEAHATLAEVRTLLDTLVLLLDRARRKR
jgi:hypothetical protein